MYRNKDLISLKSFSQTINSNRSVPEEAFKIQGFSEDFPKNKETFEKIADELLDFVRDKQIVIHMHFRFKFFKWRIRINKK